MPRLAIMKPIFKYIDYRAYLEDYYNEKNYEHWIKTDVSSEKILTPCHLISQAFYIDGNLNQEDFSREFARLIKKCKKNFLSNILIFSRDGKGYRAVAKKISGKKPGNTGLFSDSGIFIYYLEGGLQAYEKYLKELELSLRPQTISRKIKPCRGCP